MIFSIVELEQSISLVLKGTEEAVLLLSEDDWKFCRELVTLLEPFKAMTEISCVHKYVSLSAIWPMMMEIKRTKLNPSPTDHEQIKQLKNQLAMSIQQRWNANKQNTDAILASLLDPRFKRLQHLDSDLKKAANERLKKLASKIEIMEEGNLEQPVKKKTKLETNLECIFGAEKTKKQTEVEEELKEYFTFPEISKSADPLVWWKTHAEQFPRLSMLAKSYLAIPATSAASERVWSIAGDTISDKRAALGDSTLDALLFIHDNYDLCYH